jgi:hypothetical protein
LDQNGTIFQSVLDGLKNSGRETRRRGGRVMGEGKRGGDNAWPAGALGSCCGHKTEIEPPLHSETRLHTGEADRNSLFRVADHSDISGVWIGRQRFSVSGVGVVDHDDQGEAVSRSVQGVAIA